MATLKTLFTAIAKTSDKGCHLRLFDGGLELWVPCPACGTHAFYTVDSLSSVVKAFHAWRRNRGRRCRCVQWVDLPYYATREFDVMAIAKRARAAGGVLPGDCVGDKPTGILAKRPTLAEFLSNGQFEDGTTRQLPTLLLFVEEGLWKACLRDKAEQEVAWTSDLTLAGLLDALERGLADHSLDWRKQKPWSPQPNKRG